MSTAKKKSERGIRTGWFSMLVVGAIVVSAGFAVGIVAGITWEEPGLVIGWLTGETDGIEWSADERDIAAPREFGDRASIDVAAPPPLGGGGRNAVGINSGEAKLGKETRDRSPDSAPRRSAEPVAVTSPKPSQPEDLSLRKTSAKTVERGEFSVQVGAFAEREGADELSESLREAGYPVYLSDSRKGARWRVRVGPHPTREDAERTAKRLEATHQLPTWVLSEES